MRPATLPHSANHTYTHRICTATCVGTVAGCSCGAPPHPRTKHSVPALHTCSSTTVLPPCYHHIILRVQFLGLANRTDAKSASPLKRLLRSFLHVYVLANPLSVGIQPLHSLSVCPCQASLTNSFIHVTIRLIESTSNSSFASRPMT